jgi:beta-N-acetylhexosaminidase
MSKKKDKRKKKKEGRAGEGAPRLSFGHAPVVLDVAGLELTSADERRIAHPLTGGVILFARNWEDRRQLVELTAAIESIRSDMLVCVDHEGGRVQRFRTDGFTHVAPMRLLGERFLDDGAGVAGSGALAALESAAAAGRVLAAELRACGVDLTFAPVLDLDHGPSGVIGDRAFARDPRMVALLGRALAQGLLQGGMASCGKHFPGHGHVGGDSHHEIPVDDRPLEAILEDDAAPYRWLAGTLASVMPAHVVYPAVDDVPAGFSPVWLKQILRERLGFDGCIFSDDLGMAGARQLRGAPLTFVEAALVALDAGCDMVLLCNQQDGDGVAIDRLLDGLVDAVAAGRWQPDPASEARRLALLPTTPPLTWDLLMRDPAYQRALERLP